MNRRIKMLTATLGLLALLVTAPSVSAAKHRTSDAVEVVKQATADPWVGAKGAALMDVNTYRVLAGKNLHQRLPMASTTKIMTAIIAIESGRLDEVVTVSHSAVKVEPSSIWLVPGEKIKLLHLVYGLMLRSGNDAAQAIAEYLGGSIEGFAKLMNEKAKSLGCSNTNFVNPHGLPHPDHYTTSYELAKISAYALRNEQFSKFVATRRISVPWPNHDNPRVWHNKNRMLTMYEGADGVKTGWTRAAGRCLVASAKRANFRLVAVVLNSPEMWGETAALMDFGFANYYPESVIVKGQFMQSVPVQNGYPRSVGLMASEDFSWPLGQGETLQIEQQWVLPEKVQAPVKKGEQIGHIRLVYQGNCLAEIPLIADQDSWNGWWQYLINRTLTRFYHLLLRGFVTQGV